MPEQIETRTIALLIDAENTGYRALPAILDELSKHGVVLAKNAYGDWSKPSLVNWPPVLERLAIRPIQNFARTSGKNASDIALVIDAMDMFHDEDFDTFAIVSSDADFSGLASRLRRSGRYVFGFGEEKTPTALRNACDDFILTDLLAATPDTAVSEHGGGDDDEERLTQKTLKRLMIEAAETYGDAEGWTNAGAAGALIKRQRPDFQPTRFGCKTFMTLFDLFDGQFETRRIERGAGTTAEFRPKPRAKRKQTPA